MSKYTTQLRYIVEAKGNMKESVGLIATLPMIRGVVTHYFLPTDYFYTDSAEVQAIIKESFPWLIDHKQDLFTKLFKHYYFREIGFETVALWEYHYRLLTSELLPYYNELWKSAILKYPIFEDMDYSTERAAEKNGQNKTNDESTQDSQGRTDSTDATAGTRAFVNKDKTNEKTKSTAWTYNSDTPQGQIDNIEDLSYLTNASKNTNDATADRTAETTNAEESTNQGKNTSTSANITMSGRSSFSQYGDTEASGEHTKGKSSGQTYMEMLQKYRDVIRNIDLEFINEYECLFMHLW